MKKLIIASLLVGSVACIAFASSNDQSTVQSHSYVQKWSQQANWNQDGNSDWQAGQNRFIEQLNLDPERAAHMGEILSSYREIPKLYFTNQADKIPEFLAQKDAELEALLTPEELAQFKQAFTEWAKKKNFKFMKFSAHQPQPKANPVIEFDVSDYLREDMQQIMNNELIELRKQLRDQGINA